MRKVYKPCLEDAVCQISEYLDCQFMRRTFLKIHQILPIFAPYWAPIGASPLIFANLNPHSYQIWFKSVQWFWRRSHLKEKFTDGWGMITIAHLSQKCKHFIDILSPHYQFIRLGKKFCD